MATYFYNVNQRSETKILDAGCGTGACLWYLAEEGFDACGIDGSRTAVQLAKMRLRYEKLEASVAVGDLVALPFQDGCFDGFIDVAGIQHNLQKSVERIMKEISRVLKPQGKFFSMMIRRGSYGWGRGVRIEPGTLKDIQEGPFAGKGKAHFFTKREIINLLRRNRMTVLSIELSTRTMNNQRKTISHYVVTAMKGARQSNRHRARLTLQHTTK